MSRWTLFHYSQIISMVFTQPHHRSCLFTLWLLKIPVTEASWNLHLWSSMKHTWVLQSAECACWSAANHFCIKIHFFADFSEDAAAFTECADAAGSHHCVADKSPLPARCTAVHTGGTHVVCMSLCSTEDLHSRQRNRMMHWSCFYLQQHCFLCLYVFICVAGHM